MIKDGLYPVMKRGFKEPVDWVMLKAGEVWKYGTTKNPATRYAQKFLDELGLVYKKESVGTLQEALEAELKSIEDYVTQFGKLPPGNKIKR